MTKKSSKNRPAIVRKVRSIKLRNERGHKFKWSGWHPIAVPLFTFAALLLVTGSALGLAKLTSRDDTRPLNAQIVTVSYDGQSQIVPSRERTVAGLLKKLDISLGEGDRVEPSLTTKIDQDDFRINVYRAVPVQIVDNGQRTTVFSAATTARSIAAQTGVEVFPEDNVDAVPTDNFLRDGALGEQVVIERATPATMNIYGTTVAVRTHATTVKELLEEKKIALAAGDTVFPAADAPVTPTTPVFVVRNGTEIKTVEEPVAAPIRYIEDAGLTFGTSAVRQEGTAGKRLVAYQIDTQNGKEVARKIIQETVIQNPVERVVAKGTKFVISNPSENIKIGERIAASQGFTGEQFQCLYNLWQKESRWSHTANNASSGAYGIPQALPGSKMGTVGADWQTNPETQIRWGLGYIKGRYGTPCGAYQHSQARGWY